MQNAKKQQVVKRSASAHWREPGSDFTNNGPNRRQLAGKPREITRTIFLKKNKRNMPRNGRRTGFPRCLEPGNCGRENGLLLKNRFNLQGIDRRNGRRRHRFERTQLFQRILHIGQCLVQQKRIHDALGIGQKLCAAFGGFLFAKLGHALSDSFLYQTFLFAGAGKTYRSEKQQAYGNRYFNWSMQEKQLSVKSIPVQVTIFPVQ